MTPEQEAAMHKAWWDSQSKDDGRASFEMGFKAGFAAAQPTRPIFTTEDTMAMGLNATPSRDRSLTVEFLSDGSVIRNGLWYPDDRPWVEGPPSDLPGYVLVKLLLKSRREMRSGKADPMTYRLDELDGFGVPHGFDRFAAYLPVSS